MSQHPAQLQAALLGHPVGHSISPHFQQAAFDALGIDARYFAWDTLDTELVGRIVRLREPDFLGANVTIPHKQAVLALADQHSAEVELTGAANTLVNLGGRLVAHNTDVGGFRRALTDNLGYVARGNVAAVLGAGGAGRAVVVALAQAGIGRIVLLNRNLQRAKLLAADLQSRLEIAPEPYALDARAAGRIADCDLVVNCTSVGLAGSASVDLSPLPPEALPEGATVVDIVANPIVTAFLRQAAMRGHRTLGGLPMLVHQGALAFELWTSRPAPIDVMMKAARTAMGLDAPTDAAVEDRL